MAHTFGRSGVAAAFLAAGMLSGAPAAGAESDAFRIGMVAEGGEAAVEGLSTIKAAFSGALAMPVEVLVARDYAALVEAHVNGRIDYAIYSAPAYAAASVRCGCVRPVAAPLGMDGSAGLRSVLIVRRGAASGEDGPGSIATGPADSLAGRLAPLASWPQARDAQAGGLLVGADSAGAAEAMFLEGSVDGFFGWAPAGPDGGDVAESGGSLARLRAAGLDGADYEIVWRSDLLRYGPHAVRADMAEERVASLAGLLENVTASPELHYYLERRHGGGFAAVTLDDYAAVIEALGALDHDGD